MRVLFLTNFYPPHDLGGWEQNCQEIAQRFATRGHACHVLTTNFGVDSRTTPEEGATRALHLQADLHYYRPLNFFLQRPRQDRSNRESLRQVLDAFQPDVIFIWGMWNLSFQIAYWAEQWLPGRVAYSVAGYWFILPDPHEAYWQSTARRAWTRALMAPARRVALLRLAREKAAFPLRLEHVACVSEYVRGKLNDGNVLPHGARVIYNGIDPAPFLSAAERRDKTPSALRLIYTGSLVAHKGVHTAIEALGLLKQRGECKGLGLTVVGGGHPDYEEQLRARVQALGLSEHVSFRGRVPRSSIPDILAGHDIFLFTSVYEEPIARTVMEAMAAGLAVIATPVGGQAEMLSDTGNALVYPPGDAEKLASCIVTLKNDPHLRLRLAGAGQALVLERFTLGRMVDEMEMWLRGIVDG